MRLYFESGLRSCLVFGLLRRRCAILTFTKSTLTRSKFSSVPSLTHLFSLHLGYTGIATVSTEQAIDCFSSGIKLYGSWHAGLIFWYNGTAVLLWCRYMNIEGSLSALPQAEALI